MQKAVEAHGGSTSSKMQLELKESLKREDGLKLSLEEKDQQLRQLQNSNRAQINQLHKALLAAKQENESLQNSAVKAVDAGSAAEPQTTSARSLSTGASGDTSCLGGLLAMLHKKTTDKAVLDAVPAVDIKELQKALEEAKADASKLHHALEKAKEMHLATCESLEAKVAAMEKERAQLALQLNEEGEKSASRAEAFKRLQQQTAAERSRDAEVLDENKAHIKQLTSDIASLRADLDHKSDEVKRIEELHQAALQELLDKPPAAAEGHLEDLAEELHQDRDLVASLASQAEAQLAKNRSIEAANELFNRMDDNRDGKISPQEFEAHRAEYERVVAENDRLSQDVAALTALQDHIAKLEAECSRVQAEEQQLRAENEHLMFIKDQARDLSSNYDQLLTEHDALRHEHQRLLDVKDSGERAHIESMGEVSGLQAEKARLEDEVAHLKASLEDQVETTETLQQEIRARAADDSAAAMDAIVQEKIAEVSMLKEEKGRLEKEVDALTSGMEESIALNERLQKELEAMPADDRHGELIQALEARDMDIEVLQQELAATLDHQQSRAPALADDLPTDVVVLQNELDNALAAVTERDVELERQQAENERLERELAVIAAQLDDSEATNVKLQQALQSSAAAGGEEADSMQENFMLRAENNRLEKELQLMTVTSEDHQAETDRLRRELAGLAAERRSGKDSREAELTQALQESGEQLDELMARIKEQQEELTTLHQEKQVLEQVRDQANVLVAEFDAQQEEAEKLRSENSALAEETRDLRLRLQDAQTEVSAVAEVNGRLALVTPWFNRAGASYINGVEVDFNNFDSVATSCKEANASHASRMLSKIESGDTVKTALQRYRLLDSESVTTQSGELEWNNNGICDFVQAVFLQYGLVPPDEPLIFELYRVFDPDPCKGFLMMEESVCLADATLRAAFAVTAVESNEEEASIIAQQLDESQQQVEGLRSHLLELEARLRRTEARATLAEKERDAIERALAASQDALTASQSSRATAPERAHGIVEPWQGAVGVDPRDVPMQHGSPYAHAAPARPMGRPAAKPFVAVERVRGGGTSRRV